MVGPGSTKIRILQLVLLIWNGKLGDNCIQNFHLGRYIVGYKVGNFEYGYPPSNELLQFYPNFESF